MNIQQELEKMIKTVEQSPTVRASVDVLIASLAALVTSAESDTTVTPGALGKLIATHAPALAAAVEVNTPASFGVGQFDPKAGLTPFTQPVPHSVPKDIYTPVPIPPVPAPVVIPAPVVDLNANAEAGIHTSTSVGGTELQ